MNDRCRNELADLDFKFPIIQEVAREEWPIGHRRLYLLWPDFNKPRDFFLFIPEWHIVKQNGLQTKKYLGEGK